MVGGKPPIEDVSQLRLEARFREIARRLFADKNVDDLETWHLAQVVEHCSRTISDIYRTVNLEQILRGDVQHPRDLEDLLPEGSDHPRRPFRRVIRVPDHLRGVGDRCLYDIGMAGVRDYKGLSLETLGICSYRMAADILSILASERELRELFQKNRVRTLPIEEEIAFLRQCATRFHLYANLLTTLREGEPSPVAANAVPVMMAPLESPRDPLRHGTLPASEAVVQPARPAGRRLSSEGEPRERILSRYERILLFADTDIDAVRRAVKRLVIDQEQAVDALCDDLLLNATGTHVRGVPQSYFLVGPTGVGKNHLMETLAGVLESMWGVDIPVLVIEGPQYTYPSDINELKGATRGFIRSDEPGLLSEFHERSSRSPLSILIVDEVEKSHSQLQKFFLPIMDRGTTLDNRGRELSFEGTILAFTSNLGYSKRESLAEPIGYRGGPRERTRSREGEADRHLRSTLSPEFVARLRLIRFAPLSPGSMEAILDLELSKVRERFRSLHGLELDLTPSARRRLLELGFSESEGARHLASVVRRHCNVEVSRRIKRDEISAPEGRAETIRYLREVRQGERAFESTSVESTVLDLAKVRLPYRRIVIDESGGEFVYTGES